MPLGSFEGIYELKGFTTEQAEALADLAMKMMANKEAISEVYSAEQFTDRVSIENAKGSNFSRNSM